MVQYTYVKKRKENKMVKLTIALQGIEETVEFVNICNHQGFDIDAQGGRYVVDAKSILGVFSLPMTGPIKLTCFANNKEAKIFTEELKNRNFTIG